jgi:hypothetical protein
MDSSANPRDRLLYALGEIALQDPTRLRAAEELLREWTSETGYFSTLQVDTLYGTMLVLVLISYTLLCYLGYISE